MTRRLVVVVLLALAAIAAGTSCARAGRTTIVAEFDDVGDLVTRANVQSRDAVVGSIASIDLAERPGETGWLARVTLELDEGTPVPQGTKAIVRSTSLLGEKFVDLVPPPDAGPQTPRLTEGAVIAVSDTSKAPELEEVFQELGALLASGALTDLGFFITAQARILEGHSDEVGRILDGSAKLLSSLARQRSEIAQALDSLRSASATLAEGTDTTNRFLDTSEQSLRVLAEQRGQLEELLVQLDRFGGVSARLLRQHSGDLDRQIKALLEIVPKLHEARDALDQAIPKLAPFAALFARAIPGDYIQLDIAFEDPLPIPIPPQSAPPTGVGDVLWRSVGGAS